MQRSSKKKGGKIVIMVNERDTAVKESLISDLTAACDAIYASVSRLQNQIPEAFLVSSGDSNHVNLDSTVPTLHQYVDRKHRENGTGSSVC